jgi:hypothetical protein
MTEIRKTVSHSFYEITNTIHVTYEISNDNMMLQLPNNERASKLPGIIQGAYTIFLSFMGWAVTFIPVKLNKKKKGKDIPVTGHGGP